jgi:hypothetical protein
MPIYTHTVYMQQGQQDDARGERLSGNSDLQSVCLYIPTLCIYNKASRMMHGERGSAIRKSDTASQQDVGLA